MGINSYQIPHFANLFGVSYRDLFNDEVPRHSVTLDSFFLDRYPVTNGEFKKFVNANPEWRRSAIPHEFDNGNYLKHWTSDSTIAKTDHPVVNINWYAAVAYCQWVGKRLPTEAEWEYAARGGRDSLFSWGDATISPRRANYSASGIGTTSAVGNYPANRFGLFDMGGNVWQFTADEWGRYSAAAQKDPVAGGDFFREGRHFLEVRTRRVIRGGSFAGDSVNLWVRYRDSHPPNGSQDFVGFRCAK